MAASVMSHYRKAGAPGHAQCRGAELVWAEATVTLALFELCSDTSR